MRNGEKDLALNFSEIGNSRRERELKILRVESVITKK